MRRNVTLGMPTVVVLATVLVAGATLVGFLLAGGRDTPPTSSPAGSSRATEIPPSQPRPSPDYETPTETLSQRLDARLAEAASALEKPSREAVKGVRVAPDTNVGAEYIPVYGLQVGDIVVYDRYSGYVESAGTLMSVGRDRLNKAAPTEKPVLALRNGLPVWGSYQTATPSMQTAGEVVTLSQDEARAVLEAIQDPRSTMTEGERRVADGRDTWQIEFTSTYSGYNAGRSFTIPGCPTDPYGEGDFVSGTSCHEHAAQAYVQREYTEVRELLYPREDLERAKGEASTWLAHYVAAFQQAGYGLIDRVEGADLDGKTRIWRARLRRDGAAVRGPCLADNAFEQVVEVTFYHSASGKSAGYELQYRDAGPLDTRSKEVMMQCSAIVNHPDWSNERKQSEIRVVQANFGEEFVTSVLRAVPIYDDEKETFVNVDRYMRAMAADFGLQGDSPIERDPVGATMRLFFDPSPDTVQEMMGFDDW